MVLHEQFLGAMCSYSGADYLRDVMAALRSGGSGGVGGRGRVDNCAEFLSSVNLKKWYAFCVLAWFTRCSDAPVYILWEAHMTVHRQYRMPVPYAKHCTGM